MNTYTYLSGAIKYKENLLLNPTDIERMVNAKDADSAFQVFNDTDYADNLLNVETKNFQQALDDDLNQVKTLFVKHLDKELFKFLFLTHDRHNIKLFFKSKYANKDLDIYQSKTGVEKSEKIKEYIMTEQNETIDIDDNVKHIIDKTKNFIGDRPFPHRIDYIVDRECFHILYNIAKNLKNKFLIDLTKLQIDSSNLKIFIRAKISSKPYEFAEKKFIKHGNIDIKELRHLYNQETENGLKYFTSHFNNKELNQTLSAFKGGAQNFWKIEKAVENMEMDYIRKTKYITYGKEIMVGYYYAKRNAIRNVRLIMTGKLNNIDSGEIKERVRKLF